MAQKSDSEETFVEIELDDDEQQPTPMPNPDSDSDPSFFGYDDVDSDATTVQCTPPEELTPPPRRRKARPLDSSSESEPEVNEEDSTPASQRYEKGKLIKDTVFLRDKNYTRAQVMNLLKKHQVSAEIEDKQELVAPSQGLPRNSLEDFQQFKKPKREQRRFAKTEQEWIEEVDEVEAYIRHKLLPFRCETNRHARKNFLKKVKSRFMIIDGKLRYYHKRHKDRRGKDQTLLLSGVHLPTHLFWLVDKKYFCQAYTL